MNFWTKNEDFEQCASRIDAIAGFDAVDNQGKTPLHFACKTGNLEIVKALIDLVKYSGSKWTLDLEDNNGDTPLQLWIEAKRTLKL